VNDIRNHTFARFDSLQRNAVPESDVNPYEPSSMNESAPVSRRFRWRVFPACLAILSGIGFLLAGINLAVHSIHWMISQVDEMELSVAWIPFAVSLISISNGAILVLSAIAWWREKWKIATICSVIGFCVLVALELLTPLVARGLSGR
jgi:hypothetical protein